MVEHLPQFPCLRFTGSVFLGLLLLTSLSPAAPAYGLPAFGETAEQANRAAAYRYPADNTGRNRRDRNGAELTADQQPNGADLGALAAIRRKIVARKDLSITAKNAKLILFDGSVTLRGPVQTNAEKKIIEDIASTVVSSAAVNNELEVIRR